ncbi:unnamed protein product, partial [marine sediment metagenome]
MAEQTVELAPGESKAVSFEATPHEAKTYQVSVNGLIGSFKAIAPVIEFYRAGYDQPELTVFNVEGVPFSKVEVINGEPVATLAHPISMDVMRGLSLTVMGGGRMGYYIANWGDTIYSWN